MTILTRKISLLEFRKELKNAHVPFEKWKTPKTVEDLHLEVQTELSQVAIVHKDGGGYGADRYVKNVLIAVCTVDDDGEIEMLCEKKRSIGNRNVQPRQNSICGKMRVGEIDTFAAAIRCIKDKLGIECNFTRVYPRPDEEPLQAAVREITEGICPLGTGAIVAIDMYEPGEPTTESYPGLQTFREMHTFICVIPKDLSPRQEIVRHSPTKNVVLDWIRVEEDTVSHQLAMGAA
ncbi:MAG: hypothetical protein WCP09_02060 [Candidatus Taylorbacteria bacterium]